MLKFYLIVLSLSSHLSTAAIEHNLPLLPSLSRAASLLVDVLNFIVAIGKDSFFLGNGCSLFLTMLQFTLLQNMLLVCIINFIMLLFEKGKAFVNCTMEYLL